MKNYFKRNKYTWIVLAPLFIGWLFNYLMYMIPFSGLLIWTVNLGIIVFWFWGGRQFALMGRSKPMNFLLGNSGWGILFLVFLWQFILLDDASRNLVLASLSQYYVLCMITLSSQIHILYTDAINANEIVIIAYALMLVVFAAGFVYQLKKGNKPEPKPMLRK